MEWTSALGGLATGAGAFLLFYMGGRLLYRDSEPVGKGDIELAGLVGAMVGFPRVIGALFLGAAANALFIIGLLIVRRRGLRDFVPYGPGLCLGAFAGFFLAA
jgi:leader peptidase (prepilin peptidase)/N-methyltransferase